MPPCGGKHVELDATDEQRVRRLLVGRTRISLSDTPRGRETANAMISAMSCAAIDVCSYICSAAAFVSVWVMWSVSSVATAPGSITITRTSGCNCWRNDSDQPFRPHFVAA